MWSCYDADNFFQKSYSRFPNSDCLLLIRRLWNSMVIWSPFISIFREVLRTSLRGTSSEIYIQGTSHGAPAPISPLQATGTIFKNLYNCSFPLWWCKFKLLYLLTKYLKKGKSYFIILNFNILYWCYTLSKCWTVLLLSVRSLDVLCVMAPPGWDSRVRKGH